MIKLFPEGNKLKGIEQLDNASGNSFYTRTEAQFFLMRIYLSERKLSKALQLSKYLHDTYPNNSVFHKYYTQILYQYGRISEAFLSARDIIKKYKLNKFGYDEDEARISHFFIGEYYFAKMDFKNAVINYEKAIKLAEISGKEKLGYSFYSHYYLGKIYFDMGDFKKSKVYFKNVIKLTNRKDELNQRAKLNLKKIK